MKKFKIASLIAFIVLVAAVLALAAPLANYYGQQAVRLYGSFIFYNTSGTAKVTLANNGTMTVTGTAIAKIDSFTLRNWNRTVDSSSTAGTDTCLMTGASSGDVFAITQYAPSYSSTPDTNIQYGVGKVTTDTVFVSRSKLAAANDMKSGGLYMIMKIDK